MVVRQSASEEELQQAILAEKAKGTTDAEIGRKFGITYRYLERLITRSRGVNISVLKASKKVRTLYPKDSKEETTSVWSFRQRGNWAEAAPVIRLAGERIRGTANG